MPHRSFVTARAAYGFAQCKTPVLLFCATVCTTYTHTLSLGAVGYTQQPRTTRERMNERTNECMDAAGYLPSVVPRGQRVTSCLGQRAARNPLFSRPGRLLYGNLGDPSWCGCISGGSFSRHSQMRRALLVHRLAADGSLSARPDRQHGRGSHLERMSHRFHSKWSDGAQFCCINEKWISCVLHFGVYPLWLSESSCSVSLTFVEYGVPGEGGKVSAATILSYLATIERPYRYVQRGGQSEIETRASVPLCKKGGVRIGRSDVRSRITASRRKSGR